MTSLRSSYAALILSESGFDLPEPVIRTDSFEMDFQIPREDDANFFTSWTIAVANMRHPHARELWVMVKRS